MRDETPGRIRGRQLQEIRRVYFEAIPLCVHCKRQGRITLGVQLDHIVPLSKGGVDSLDPFENRQGLCQECHDAKTREDLGWGPSGDCDVDGMPTDPLHPWNRRK